MKKSKNNVIIVLDKIRLIYQFSLLVGKLLSFPTREETQLLRGGKLCLVGKPSTFTTSKVIYYYNILT